MQTMLLLLLSALALASASSSKGGRPADPFPVVRVAQGQLRGRLVVRPPEAVVRHVYSFEGIPFAKPPIGSKRFKDPEEAEAWSGVRNATEASARCIQNVIDTGAVEGVEDCLYLNVYTVSRPSTWTSQRRPVVLFIHGGGWVQGSGDTRDTRPDALLANGVVYVGTNYRLGVLGFLSSEDAEAPGNAAMKDQVLALRWVQRNIAAFGGDPHKITIMGESAGAGSVQLHLLSPLSRGLFHGAIAVSGSALPRWALQQEPRRSALAIRERFSKGCSDLPATDLVPCLQRVPANELVAGQYDNLPQKKGEAFFGSSHWRPTLEVPGSSPAPFLTSDPERSLINGEFDSSVPYMTGFTSAEGIIYLGFGRLFQDPSRWAEADRDFEDILRWQMPLGLRTREAVRQVRQFYFGNESIADAPQNLDKIRKFVQLCTDLDFAVGEVHSAKLMTKRGSRVYVYRFSRDGPLNWYKKFMNATFIPGVSHGDDMAYVFDFLQPGTDQQRPVPQDEQPLRARQAKIFANMIKTGNPTPEGSGLLKWPAFSLDKQRYMDMDVELTVHDRVLAERIEFWTRLLDSRQEYRPVAAAAPARKGK